MAGMSGTAATAILALCLGAFAFWQIRDGAQKDALLDAQAREIDTLTEQARKMDETFSQWRQDNERITQDRADKREHTRETARRDSSFREHLDTPLHPALRAGNGLLGKKRDNALDSGGASGAHAGS